MNLPTLTFITMRKPLFCLLFFAALATGFEAHAQYGSSTHTLTDATGRQIAATEYNNIDGTPFLSDKWIAGKAIGDDGKIYAGLKLKYNTYDGMWSFIYADTDEPLKFDIPIKTFVLLTTPQMVFVDGYPKIDRQNVDSYYQLLSYGKAHLLKLYFKTIVERRSSNSDKVDGAYNNGVLYYVFKDRKMTHFKTNKDDILKLMSDKSAQINEFITQNSLNPKSDDDLKKLFNYYNTL